MISDALTCLLLMIMITVGYKIRVLNVKAGFLKGELHNYEKIYTKVLKGFEIVYSEPKMYLLKVSK